MVMNKHKFNIIVIKYFNLGYKISKSTYLYKFLKYFKILSDDYEIGRVLLKKLQDNEYLFTRYTDEFFVRRIEFSVNQFPFIISEYIDLDGVEYILKSPLFGDDFYFDVSSSVLNKIFKKNIK